MSWFIAKLQGELGQFRVMCLSRNLAVQLEAERLASKIVQATLRAENDTRAMSNLNNFRLWQNQDLGRCLREFGQSPIIDDQETQDQLETAIR